MDGTSGTAGSTAAQGQQNIDQLKQLFDEFSSTLVNLRVASTEGQQKIETSRVRPQ